MTSEEFLNEFGHLATAPNGVMRLRRLILELAIRGRLVPQDAADERAKVLLARLSGERDRQVTEGLIRKPKPTPEITREEVPFKVPSGWEWARLADLTTECRRGRSPSYPGGTTAVVNQKCIRHRTCVDLDFRKLTNEASRALPDWSILRIGDVLINSTGAGTLGRVGWIRGRVDRITADSHVSIVRPIPGLASEYIGWFLHSREDLLVSLGTGTTKQKELNAGDLRLLAVPCPPVGEQRRIVERIEELMILCDQLDEERTRVEELRAATARSALSTIIQVDSKGADRASALVRDHLALALAPGDGAAGVVAELRKTILDLAVGGRLVSQDPTDEPAAVLLDRIPEERARLLEEKTIKRSEPPPPQNGLARGGLLPGYAEVRLGELCAIQPKVRAAEDTQGMFLPMERVPFAWGVDAHPELRPWGEISRGYTHFASGDVLVAKITPCFQNQKSVVVKDCGASFGAGTTELHVLRPLGGVEPRWLLMVVKSQAFIKQGVARMTGTAGHQRVPRAFVEEFTVALPPVGEQRRIIRRVDELMSVCDELERMLLGERVVAFDLAESAVGSVIAQVE